MLRSFILAAILVTPGVTHAQAPVPTRTQDVGRYRKMIKHIQEVSVYIETSDSSSGSGVVFRRGKDLFVITNWHVVSSAAVTKDNKTTFNDVKVIKFGVRDGRMCERREIGAEIVAFSEDYEGYDLAVLRLRDPKFISEVTTFYPEEKEIPFVGMPLYHVGCLNGIEAPASLTTGILSAQGRVINERTFDQITATSFPGSSGGGVFDSNGKCIGLLTRRSGETLGYINPIREIRTWARDSELEWVVDPKAPLPNHEDMIKSRQDFSSVNNLRKILK